MDSENASGKKPSIRRAAEARRSASLMRRVLLGLKARMDDELRSKHLTSAQWRFLTELKERLLAYADGILARLEAEVWVGVGLAEMHALNATLERGLANLEDAAPAE